MTRFCSALRRLRQRHLQSEAGFGLIELVIAAGVMALVMASLAATATMAFGDAAISRNRTAATGLANQALEEVRALPYAQVATGLSTSDLDAGTDKAITKVGTSYTFGGERIPNGNVATVSPLNPHRATRTIDGMPYTTAVYVTYLNDDPTLLSMRVTARVSWVSSLRASIRKFVEVQTIVRVAPDGHVYKAPWQASLFAASSISDGGITFTPYSQGSAAISGLDLAESTMTLPQESTDMSVEQIEYVKSTVRTSGVGVRRTGQPATTAGLQTVTVASDSDPSQPKPVYARSSTATQSSSSVSLSSGSTSYTVTSSGGDTGTATATVLSTASTTNTCANTSGVTLVDSLPCGLATTTQGGTMTAQLNVGGLGAATLASMGSSSNSGAAHSNRDLVAQQTSGSCLQTSGDGCIRASHRTAMGAVRIGALPATMFVLAPAGFDYLLKMDNFSRYVTAEAGIGNGAPSVTSTGTIQYWNGIGYTSLPVTSGVASTIPVSGVTVTDSLSSTTISLTGVIRTGGTTSGACASPCAKASAQAESPIVGDLRYTIVVGGATVADLNYHIDFGTVLAKAEYTPGA